MRRLRRFPFPFGVSFLVFVFCVAPSLAGAKTALRCVLVGSLGLSFSVEKLFVLQSRKTRISGEQEEVDGGKGSTATLSFFFSR